MYSYRVVTEVEDGPVTKEPGKVVQNLKQINKYYVADSIEQVWDEIELDRMDEGVSILAIIREHPIVGILK